VKKCFPPFSLDEENQCLNKHGVPIPLTPKAFAVLAYLVEHAGRTIPQKELLHAVWPAKFIQAGVLKVCVAEIRKALGDSPQTPQFIGTVRQRGYRFLRSPSKLPPMVESSGDGETNERLARRLTTKPSVADRYVRAQYLLEQPDLNSKREAVLLLRQATSEDEQYPLPWLSLARAEMFAAMAGLEAPADPIQRGIAALTRALQLDPDLAEAHALLAVIVARHEWDWKRARTHFDAALASSPFSAETRAAYAAEYLAPLGFFDEALEENRRALQLDPFSMQVASGRGYILARPQVFGSR